MNAWRSRLTALIALWAFNMVHSEIATFLPNSPLGMLLVHGSAGLIDLGLIYCAPTFLSGPVCDDTEILCLISIVANFIGWLLYLAYTPPEFYNSFMWGLGCVQSVRLFIVDSGDANSLGKHLVCRPGLLGA